MWRTRRGFLLRSELKGAYPRVVQGNLDPLSATIQLVIVKVIIRVYSVLYC
jgi:hypothetical protein